MLLDEALQLGSRVSHGNCCRQVRSQIPIRMAVTTTRMCATSFPIRMRQRRRRKRLCRLACYVRQSRQGAVQHHNVATKRPVCETKPVFASVRACVRAVEAKTTRWTQSSNTGVDAPASCAFLATVFAARHDNSSIAFTTPKGRRTLLGWPSLYEDSSGSTDTQHDARTHGSVDY